MAKLSSSLTRKHLSGKDVSPATLITTFLVSQGFWCNFVVSYSYRESRKLSKGLLFYREIAKIDRQWQKKTSRVKLWKAKAGVDITCTYVAKWRIQNRIGSQLQDTYFHLLKCHYSDRAISEPDVRAMEKSSLFTLKALKGLIVSVFFHKAYDFYFIEVLHLGNQFRNGWR